MIYHNHIEERFFDILLPDGGYLLTSVECYFDESGTHAGSPVLCVAGYIMEKGQAINLSKRWTKELKSHGLPYFRMSECAHGNGAFADMKDDKRKRIEIQTRMIQIIKDRTIKGLAFTIKEEDFNRALPDSVLGSCYSFAAHCMLVGVRSWLQDNPKVDKIGYFFEAGHSSQGEAGLIMENLFKNTPLKEEYKYAGHAFLPKESSPCVQAADLLSWQWFTDKKRQIEGKSHRKDFLSLVEHTHETVHLDEARITEIAKKLHTIKGSDLYALRLTASPNPAKLKI